MTAQTSSGTVCAPLLIYMCIASVAEGCSAWLYSCIVDPRGAGSTSLGARAEWSPRLAE